MMCHSETTCRIWLIDLFGQNVAPPAREGCERKFVLGIVLMTRQGKMNKDGKILYNILVQNLDVEICPIGALAFYLLEYWLVSLNMHCACHGLVEIWPLFDYINLFLFFLLLLFSLLHHPLPTHLAWTIIIGLTFVCCQKQPHEPQRCSTPCSTNRYAMHRIISASAPI